jgi:hypothetical protein
VAAVLVKLVTDQAPAVLALLILVAEEGVVVDKVQVLDQQVHTKAAMAVLELL